MAVKSKKSSTRRLLTKSKAQPVVTPAAKNLASEPIFQSDIKSVPINEWTLKKKLYSLLAIFVLIILVYILIQRGLLVAAVVNGRPIFSWRVYSTLLSRFGSQTLEGIISEELINQSAKDTGVAITAGDIDAKEQEIIQGLGEGSNLDDLLKFQGMTRDDFDRQIKLQLTVEKIVEQQVVLEEKQIIDYMDKNKSALTATDPAAFREEAKMALVKQKVGEQIQPWYNDLKDKAKIIRFLQ